MPNSTFNTNSHNLRYPFNEEFFLECVMRVGIRRGHKTLPGDDDPT